MDALAKGHYYQKQIECKSQIIAWSHRSRFQLALKLIGPSPNKMLDYGCGDGSFLALAAPRLQAGWGADVTEDQIKDCQSRFTDVANLRFSSVQALSDPIHFAAYDVVTCMETLEHCTAPIVEIVLRDLARLVKPDGRVIISVPIEIGPTFLIKSVVRKIAAWRGLSDYRYYERYTVGNALRMIFASRSTRIDRPVYGGPEGEYHSHYGFNWRALREKVRQHLIVEKTRFSPLGWLGGWVSSQAWFLCRPKPAGS